MSVSQVCKIRISSSLAGLTVGWLQPAWELPPPTTPLYRAYSDLISLSDGGATKRGIASVRLTWVEPTVYQAIRINEIADLGDVYATVNRGWSAINIDDWIDVSGKAFIDSNVAPVGGSKGLVMNAITLVINNLSTENDPASF